MSGENRPPRTASQANRPAGENRQNPEGRQNRTERGERQGQRSFGENRPSGDRRRDQRQEEAEGISARADRDSVQTAVEIPAERTESLFPLLL